MPDPASIKALFFDVFGTVVDWRTSIARESEAVLKPKGYALDWLAFADAWRDEYQPAMEEVRTGVIPFSKLDVLHRRNLERILPRFKVSGLDEPTMAHLNRAWHRLDGWPDATPGLQRLHKKFLIAPVSNGNISLMAGIARRNDFPWDAILGAEIAGDYKPKPRVYLRAAEAFDCEPGECMMVAAHSGDLAAAAATGLKTAHVARPNEHGPGKGETEPTRAGRLRGVELHGTGRQARRMIDNDRSHRDRAANCIARRARFAMVARTRLRKTDAVPAREIRQMERREDRRLRRRVRPRAVARVARLERRPQSGAPDQRSDPLDRQLRGLARHPLARGHARAAPVQRAEADQHAPHARCRGVLLRGAAPHALRRRRRNTISPRS